MAADVVDYDGDYCLLLSMREGLLRFVDDVDFVVVVAGQLGQSRWVIGVVALVVGQGVEPPPLEPIDRDRAALSRWLWTVQPCS